MKLFKRNFSLLLALLLLWTSTCLGSAVETLAVDASTYISTSYNANLSVKTTKAVNLMQYPVASSTAKYTLPVNTMLSVKALHKNTSGAYWYEVLYYDMTLYIDATAATLVDHLTGDVTVKDLMSPAALGYGQGFPITGTVTATLNKLGTITAAVHNNSNINAAPVIDSNDTVNGTSYTLDDSALDYNLIFSDLPGGSYTYLLTVEAISYYLDDSGNLAESVQTVVLDNKPLIVTQSGSPNPIIAKGIDVSVHQGTINWASVASQIDFAILRIGWEYTLDTQFKANAAGCNANGIPFGVYIYSYAESEAEAIKEAEFVISALKNYDVDLPVFFDIEDECQSSLGSAAIQNIVKAFCETIKDAGYEPGLYTFLSWFNSYFSDSYYNSLPKWVAQIGVNSCSYTKGLTMWQYSWTGSFSGISGDVDCNYYYGEFPGKNSDSSYLASCTYYPSNLTVTIDSDVNMRQYPSTSYSTIETLAAGTDVHVTGVYKNASGAYWYQVDRNGATGYISSNYATVKEFRFDDLSVVGPNMADIALNAGYYLKGNLSAKYNNLYKVHAKVYNGEDTLSTPVMTSSATPNAKEYTLANSDVCDNLIFSDLETGYYTYEISTDVKNYYVNDGALTSKDENVVLWTAPFTVGNAAITPPASVTCIHNVVTDTGYAATCTEAGLSDGTRCTKCGVVFTNQTVIPAKGHSYSSVTIPATCQDYEKVKYTCDNCDDSYTIYSYELHAQWSETKPEGVHEDLLETKTQYRYSDYETFTSETPNLDGYELVDKQWISTGSTTHQYVDGWPTGFDTTHSLYSAYSNSAVSASESATSKVVSDSNGIVGYVFYHWCYGTYLYGPTNRTTSKTKDSTHTTFHAFTESASTVDPSTLTVASDGSVTYSSASNCTDTWWWYYIPLYKQTYTTYKAEFTYEGWGAWSEWSDTAVTASGTRKVETRTMYRYTGAEFADHSYVDGVCTICGDSLVCQHENHNINGICTVCGEVASHNYVGGACTICGKAEVLPTIIPKYPSLSLEDEVLMNIYFTVTGMENVKLEDMGLLTWSIPQSNGTIENAQGVIPGASETGSMLVVSTNGIPAKEMGDTVYFKIYAKMADGSYVYSKLLHFSPKTYAMGQINGSASSELKALCVALLNYGAAAQVYFDYRPYDLMNSDLTKEQLAMVRDYDAGMVGGSDPIDAKKVGNFTNSGGFAKKYPSVSLAGAFQLNYYFTPSYRPDTTPRIYYWDEVTYNSVEKLTAANANGCILLEGDDILTATIEGIPAKHLDDTIYVAAGYMHNGSAYCTGVLPYSISDFCAAQLRTGNELIRPIAAATVVYGYYAKAYFDSVN